MAIAKFVTLLSERWACNPTRRPGLVRVVETVPCNLTYPKMSICLNLVALDPNMDYFVCVGADAGIGPCDGTLRGQV